jgi:hypothetical protein
MFPNELRLKVYAFCDYNTRVKLNNVFGWSYMAVNPLKNVDLSSQQIERKKIVLPSIISRVKYFETKPNL